MIRNLFSTLLLWLICTLLVCFCFVVVASAQELKPRPAHIGLTYPLSSNGTEAPQLSNRFSLHILAGVSRNEKAFCLSGISSVVLQDAQGLVLSGVSNHVGRAAHGVQIAGILNRIKGEAQGLQLAGIANIAGNTGGSQVAGIINTANHTDGLQLAGFANQASQAAVQVAGFTNIARKESGTQVAGFANVSGDSRIQVAGFVNVARKVSMVQVGLINIAAQNDYPVGLVNIVGNGEKQLGLSLDETGSTLISFRSGGRILYGILSAGYNFKDDNARYVLEGGIGAHLPVTSFFRVNMEVTTAALSDLQYDVYMKSTTRLLAALKLGNRVELFAGPSFNYLGYERGQRDIRDRYLWKERGRDHINGLYLGATGGIQLSL